MGEEDSGIISLSFPPSPWATVLGQGTLASEGKSSSRTWSPSARSSAIAHTILGRGGGKEAVDHEGSSEIQRICQTLGADV